MQGVSWSATASGGHCIAFCIEPSGRVSYSLTTPPTDEGSLPNLVGITSPCHHSSDVSLRLRGALVDSLHSPAQPGNRRGLRRCGSRPRAHLGRGFPTASARRRREELAPLPKPLRSDITSHAASTRLLKASAKVRVVFAIASSRSWTSPRSPGVRMLVARLAQALCSPRRARQSRARIVDGGSRF